MELYPWVIYFFFSSHFIKKKIEDSNNYQFNGLNQTIHGYAKQIKNLKTFKVKCHIMLYRVMLKLKYILSSILVYNK